MTEMRFLVTGGTQGVGAKICQEFNGVSLSRTNGYDITKCADRKRIALMSLDYDVFVNNAFDGPFHKEDSDFGQVKLLWEVAALWRDKNKSGHIINIGSSTADVVVAPDPERETYRIPKAALKAHSRQWTQAFKQNSVPFRTSLLTLDRCDTHEMRASARWTGNGIDLSDVISYIAVILSSGSNTCVEEIVALLNFQYGSGRV